MATQAEFNFLEQKAYEWALKVRELYNTPVPAQYASEKAALLSFAKSVKETIEKVAGPLNALAPMNELGAIPIVIGVVGVAGAAAAITKWTTDYYAFKTKIDDRNALINSGLTPQQATNIVAQTQGVGWSDNLVKVAKFGAIGFGLYFAARKLRII